MDALKNIKLFSAEEDQTRDRVLLLPGYLFFTESVPLPRDVGQEELHALAELTLESLTPFALEQLVWGYAWDRNGETLLVYAAYRERLRKEGFTDIEAYRQVYPDFLVLQNCDSEEPRTQVLIQSTGVTLAAFPARSRVPQQILGSPVSEEEDDPQGIIQDLIEEMDEAAFPLGETLDQPFRARVPNQGPIQFVLENETEPPISDLPEPLTWPADLRDEAFCKSTRATRTRDLWLWRGMLAAAAIAVLLVALEGLRLGGTLWLQNRLEQIDAQAAPVAQIQSRGTLVNRLEQRASSLLEPFQALRLMNRNRPPTIYFTGMDAEVPDRLVIDGVARTVNEVNSYTQALSNTGYFGNVDPRNVRSQAGQVTFTLELTIGELPASGTTIAAGPNGTGGES